MKNSKEKGITLVALVITIVIMLILAGVTINIAIGENGLFKQTKKAVEKYKDAQEKEDKSLTDFTDELDIISANGEAIQVTDKNPGELSGEGTEKDPYLIESIEDLVSFSKKVNEGNKFEGKTIKLGVNLDFKNEISYVDSKTIKYGDINGANGAEELKTELTTGKGFSPIGNKTNYFNGSFNGAGHTISNLYINVAENYKGLFGYVESKGNIKNLVLSNASVDCKGENIGILAGYINGGTIDSIKSEKGTIKGNLCVGGIVGGIYSGGTINNCVNASNVVSYGAEKPDNNGNYHSETGGIVGRSSNSSINNSHNTGKIKADKGLQIGGIVGHSSGNSVVDSCSNSGEVGDLNGSINAQQFGGVVGTGVNTTISKCYNLGKIYGANCVGGIIGWIDLNVVVEDCYNAEIITAIEGTIGGICGISIIDKSGSEIKNCYNIGKVSATKKEVVTIRRYSRKNIQ